MFLKRLELFGFKSFPHKTTLTFEPGVTAIVGPNGCGKSNVSDAIKWVLGEQSAKQMRGTRMGDVLFSGTDNMPPYNVAEVSMTFDNESHILPVEYTEVTISRRMLRTGESEYYLNKNLCRLKDIHQLFLGTGVGTSAYSVIEQGRIGQIVNMKPEDRRYIFEEAAGITKYKAHKKEALRKLDATEQNLLRVADVIAEIKRQLNSINRQVSKARRYKELRDELVVLDLKVFYAEMKNLEESLAKIAENKKSLRSREEELGVRMISEEARIEEKRLAITELINGIQAQQIRYNEIDKSFSLFESKLDFNKDRTAEIESNIAAILDGNLASERKIADGVSERESVETGLTDIRAQKSIFDDKLRELENELSRTDNSRAQNAARISEKEDVCLEIVQNMSRLHNDIESVKAGLVHLGDRMEKIAQGIREYQNKNSSLKSLWEEKNNEKASLEEKIAALEDQELTFTCDIEANALYLEETQRSLADVAKEKEVLKSRFELLSQWKRDYEGFMDGVKAAFKIAEEPERNLKGLKGPLAGMVILDEKYAAAIGAALREDLQTIVVDDGETAVRLLDILFSEQKGFAKFFIRDKIASAPIVAQNGVFERPGVHGRALDCVRFDGVYRDIMDGFLNETLVVENTETARKIIADNLWTGRIVTLRGECFDRNGRFLSGGSHDTKSKDLLLRDTQIAEIEKRILESCGREDEVRFRTNAIRESLETKEKEKLVLQDKILIAKRELAVCDNEYSHLSWQVTQVGDEIFILEAEQKDLNKTREEYVSALKEKENQSDRFVEEEWQAKDALETLKKDMTCLDAKRDEVKETMANIRVTKATVDEKIVSESAKADALLVFINEEREEKNKRDIQYMELSARKEQVLLESGEIKERLQLMRKDIEALTAQISIKKYEQDNCEKILENEMAGVKLTSQDLRQAQTQGNQIEVAETEQKMTFENKDELIHSAYHTRYRDLGPEFKCDSIAPEWPERIALLKQKLEALGPVNEGVIEENEELENRCKFLIEQQADLIEAKESLLKVIRKINTTTREQFVETFEAVRKYFTEYFKILFNGGQADLLLLDENNVLESGVDILAKPPGKKLQNITLMSGGEKAMTAIAILFALFTVRPSPFCVLDEIDAPLDDANVNRFVTLLERFLSKTQFIIISHNKATISIADTLYGITMEIPGISRLISARLIEGRQQKLNTVTA